MCGSLVNGMRGSRTSSLHTGFLIRRAFVVNVEGPKKKKKKIHAVHTSCLSCRSQTLISGHRRKHQQGLVEATYLTGSYAQAE